MSYKRSLAAFIGLIAASAVTVGGPAEAACESIHLRAKLDLFDVNAGLQSFYWHEENAPSARFRVTNISDDCVGHLISVAYATKDITATSNVDYTPVSGQTPALNDEAHPDDNPSSTQTFYDVDIPIINNDDDPVVESAQISLSDPAGGDVIEPSVVPLYIVDDDGVSPRVGLDSYPYSPGESEGGVEIPVFRGGDAGGTVTVSYSFAPGSQNPATPGQDFMGAPGSVTFQPLERLKLIPFTIVNDSMAEPPETLQIAVQGPGVVPASSTTTVTILDNEEAVPPTSKLHHPRHGWRYPYNDYRIREIHVFTKDEQGGSGVVKVELALRRSMKNGKCGWWNGKRFRGGDCSNKLWRPMKVYEPGYFYYFRMKALTPSVGTDIMKYTGYARAIDGAGNVEGLLQQRRNRNTFEIKRKAA